MAKGYWIGHVDVHNEEAYKAYVAANPAIFKKFGGRYVVRGGKFTGVEGQSRSRNVVIEFADYETALACYRSANISKTSRCGSRTRSPISSSWKVMTVRNLEREFRRLGWQIERASLAGIRSQRYGCTCDHGRRAACIRMTRSVAACRG